MVPGAAAAVVVSQYGGLEVLRVALPEQHHGPTAAASPSEPTLVSAKRSSCVVVLGEDGLAPQVSVNNQPPVGPWTRRALQW